MSEPCLTHASLQNRHGSTGSPKEPFSRFSGLSYRFAGKEGKFQMWGPSRGIDEQKTEGAGLTYLSVSTLCVCDLFAQGSIEVEGSADESKVGKGLGEISQRLAMVACFFGIEPKMIGITQHLFEK